MGEGIPRKTWSGVHSLRLKLCCAPLDLMCTVQGSQQQHRGLEGGLHSLPCCMPEVSCLICTVQGSNDFVEDLGMEQPTRMDLDFVAHGLGDEDARHAVRASDYRLPHSARRPGAQVCPKAEMKLLKQVFSGPKVNGCTPFVCKAKRNTCLASQRRNTLLMMVSMGATS